MRLQDIYILVTTNRKDYLRHMLNKRFTFFIAWRYLFSRKSRNIINVITGISMLTIGVVTAALVILLSAFNGLEQTVKNIFQVFDPHLRVEPANGKTFIITKDELVKIRGLNSVIAATPCIEEHVLILYKDKQQIVLMKGVDNSYFDWVPMHEMLSSGNLNLKKNGGAILGEGLAANLQVNIMNITQKIAVYYPKKGKINILNPFNEGHILPTGIFSINHEYTNNLLIVPIAFASDITGLKNENEISSLEIAVNNEKDIKIIKKHIKSILGNAIVIKDRFEQHALMYKVMRAEKLAVFLIVILVLIIASFNIISSLTMLLVEKKKDIMVMWSMGAHFKQIKSIYLIQGTLVASLGAIGGIIIGTLVSLVQIKTGWIKLGAYEGANAYPMLFIWTDFVFIFLTVNVIGFGAAWLRMISIRFNQTEQISLIK